MTRVSMGIPPCCFCGHPTQNTGSDFICALAKCPFRVSASPPLGSQPTTETCALHGEPIEIITQRPMGHLPGRRYARCALPIKQRCAYFRLIESIPVDRQPRQGFGAVPSAPGRMSTSFFSVPQQSVNADHTTAKSSKPAASRVADSSPSGDSPPQVPKCRCDSDARKRTVKKEGPNKHRTFFVCAKPVGEQCGFFEWGRGGNSVVHGAAGDERGRFISNATRESRGFHVPNEIGRGGETTIGHPNTQTFEDTELEQDEEIEEAPKCICGNLAARRTVKKQGPNHGKDFFVCEKPQDTQCRFFEWAKQRPASAGSLWRKRLGERPHSAGSSADVAKRPRFSPRGKIALGLHEIDTLTFKLHLGMPAELRETVKKFADAKFIKTEMLGLEQAVVPLTKLSKLEKYLMANACTKVECNVPEKVLKRITEYLASEKKREADGDVITRSLEELLPPVVCEKLMQFQWHGVHFALKRGGRCLIGDDMGLGKTLQAIAVARVYNSDWPLIVICPSSLRLNWKEEILRWLEEDVLEDDILVMMTGKDVDRPFRRVTIVSYDLFRKIPERSLRRVNFVIADESHYLKSGSALRSKAVIPLVKKSRRALLLSGTPALSRPVELFPQINALLPSLFPSYREFVERYCAAHQGYFGYDVSGASNLSELHTLLRGSVLIRRKKEEVLTQLPDKQRQVLWVQTKPQAMRKVQQAMSEMESAKEAANEASSEGRGQILQNAVKSAQNELYTLTGLAKLDAIREVCKDTAETGCKFIVFGHHTQILQGLDDYLTQKLKLEIIRIDGKTPQATRQGLCKRFQTDPACRVALLSITAAGVGLTLTAATVVLFAELYWNPGSLLQAEDRAHRIGQKDCVLVKYLLARNTIDESMWSTVRRKLNVVGHSLTGAAARMDVNDDNTQLDPPKSSGIEHFFRRKAGDVEGSAQSRATLGSQRKDDSVVEIIDDDSLPAPTTPPARPRGPPTEHQFVSDVSFPTTLREAGSLRTTPEKSGPGPLFTDLPDSVDLRESFRVQEQLDQDIALARRLQAQFDTEE